MPATPTPATRPAGATASAPAAARIAASARASGSTSAPVATAAHGVGSRCCATTRPPASSTTALQNVVPTSIPSTRADTLRRGVEDPEHLGHATAARVGEESALLRRGQPDRLLPKRAAGDEPVRPAVHRRAQLPTERLVVDAGGEHGPGDVKRVGHARALLLAPRVLELQDPRAALLQQHGALPYEVRLAGRERSGLLVVEAVGHELDDAEQAGPAAVLERRPDELRGVAVEVLAIRSQEDHTLA